MNLAELKDAPVLVAGAGVSGRAAAAALVELGARVTVTRAPSRSNASAAARPEIPAPATRTCAPRSSSAFMTRH